MQATVIETEVTDYPLSDQSTVNLNNWDTVSYADSYDIIDNQIVLNNPQSFTLSNTSDNNVILGKYIISSLYNRCYYIPTDANIYSEPFVPNTGTYIKVNKATYLTLKTEASNEITYVASKDNTTYPVDGEQNGYWYRYKKQLVEDGGSEGGVPTSVITTAISEHNISIAAHEDIRKAITQADYSEDDSSSMSYIKNRPFYEGKTFTAINTILNNEIVNFFSNVAEIEIAEDFLINSQIKPNTKYKVIFDGTEFIEESMVYDLSQMGFFHGAFIGENPVLAAMAMELEIDNYIPEKPFIISSFNGYLILMSFTPGDTHTITLQELQPCETGIIFEEQATVSAADLTSSNRMPVTIIKNVGVNLLPGNEYKIIINNYEHNGFYIMEDNIPGIMIGNELGAIIQAANDYIFMPMSPNLIVSKKHITIKKSNDTVIYDNELNIAVMDISSISNKILFLSTAVDDSLENPERLDFSGQIFTAGENIILSVDGETYDLTLTSSSNSLIGLYEEEEKLIGLSISDSMGTLMFGEETVTANVKLEGPSIQRKTLNSKFIDILPSLTPLHDDGLVLGAENGLWKPIEAQASGSSLPGVSTADNDKVLMVVNGVWQPASITSGDEVAY